MPDYNHKPAVRAMASIGQSGDVPHHPADTLVPHKNHKTRHAATEFPTFHSRRKSLADWSVSRTSGFSTKNPA